MLNSVDLSSPLLHIPINEDVLHCHHCHIFCHTVMMYLCVALTWELLGLIDLYTFNVLNWLGISQRHTMIYTLSYAFFTHSYIFCLHFIRNKFSYTWSGFLHVFPYFTPHCAISHPGAIFHTSLCYAHTASPHLTFLLFCIHVSTYQAPLSSLSLALSQFLLCCFI